jgi:hypothetical protein
MINGQAKARAVQFFLDSNVVPLELIGDGLLPADVDGKTKPKSDAPAPIVGTQDDGAGYGGTFDALNIWNLTVLWNSGRLRRSPFQHSYRSRHLTRSSLVASYQARFPGSQQVATASHSRGSPMAAGTSMSFPTVSARPTVSPIVTSAPTNLS